MNVKKIGGIFALICGIAMLGISGLLLTQGETLQSLLTIIGFGFVVIVIGILVLNKK